MVFPRGLRRAGLLRGSVAVSMALGISAVGLGDSLASNGGPESTTTVRSYAQQPKAHISVLQEHRKLIIDVDRDLPDRFSYRGVLEKRDARAWNRIDRFRTKGQDETYRFKALKIGRYRVRTMPNRFSGSATSRVSVVRLSAASTGQKPGGSASTDGRKPPKPTPTLSPSPTPSRTATPRPSASPSATTSATATPTPRSPSPTPTATSPSPSHSQTASTSPTPSPSVTSPAPTPDVVGARLPVSFGVGSMPGTVRFVSVSGSDSTGTGSLQAPFKTLGKAESVSGNGDSIVVRGGTYPVAGNAVSIDRVGLTVTAYPGEVPVFDGSIAAPGSVTVEGSLRSFAYQPLPAGVGEGLGLSNLPVATFSGGQPTGLAAQRGWRCVTGSATYSVPVPTSADADGCSGSANVITAFWPDQVWVNGQALQQVADKSRVVKGTFWVDRASASDANPGAGRLFLHQDDAVDMSKVAVSSSKGNFIHVAADGVTLQGVRIQRHSPVWSNYSVTVTTSVDDFTMRDVAFDDNAGISFKLAGGSAAGGAQLVRRPVLDHVSVTDAGWMGSVNMYTNATEVRDSVFDRINAQREFSRGPQSGAIKAMKTHDMVVTGSTFANVWGHALWWDQSNYNATVAGSRFLNNSHTSVFFEISHRLTMVNNYLQAPATPQEEEGHSNVRLAGSSGVRLVNNTILGGPVGVGIYTDPRSKTYGTSNRPCSEHTVRYGQGGNSGTDCNVPYTSDFDFARPGAYSPTGAANQTPGMNWKPAIDIMVNNIIANQTGTLPTGWTPCGGRTPLCVYGFISSPAVQVPMNSVFHSGMTMNGNVYQTSGSAIARFAVTTGQAGGFTATDVAGLKGTSGLGSPTYNLAVEANGKSGTGWVNPDGSPTSTLTAAHNQAAPVPTDAAINTYIPAGTRHYGTLD